MKNFFKSYRKFFASASTAVLVTSVLALVFSSANVSGCYVDAEKIQMCFY